MESIGQVNKYYCDSCNNRLFTINLNTGVTPFMISCTSCNHMMNSSFYSVDQHEVTCTHVWYRPLVDEYKTLDSENQEHVLKGGLLLEKIGLVRSLKEDNFGLDSLKDYYK